MLEAWLGSFAFTLAVELPIAVVVLWRLGRPGRTAGAATLGTALTHPGLWFVLPLLVHDYWSYIAVGELGIVVVEAGVLHAALRPPSWRHALSASALMNGSSYLAGLLGS